MTTTMSIRELTRNGSKLAEYDYIEIEDRKSHEYKGIFVPARDAKEVKEFLHKKRQKEKEEALKRITRFAGKGKIDPKYDDMTSSEIRKSIAKERYGEE